MHETEPSDKMTNGKVTIELEISDPVTDLGIKTRLLDFDSEKSFVTEELADHLKHEFRIDVEEHDIEVTS